jgi:predicted AAA+ superfamily ATPase
LENIIFREFLLQTENAEKIKFWRTQDKQEIDFVVGNKAFEVKFNEKKIDYKKYDKFIKAYPKIKFGFLTYEDVLRKFYKFKV